MIYLLLNKLLELLRALLRVSEGQDLAFCAEETCPKASFCPFTKLLT
jgi:hypothetical protein